MNIRAALRADIPRLARIRGAVRENRLRARRIGPADYLPYVEDGRCWVWDEGGAILGFSALDASAGSLWALFVAPGAEGRGIGRALLDQGVAEARRRGLAALSLSTDPGTRAESFYEAAGWVAIERDGRDGLTMRLTLDRP